MIVVAIGPAQSKPRSRKTLTEIAAGEAENVLYVPDFVDDPDAIMENALNDVFDKICGMYLTTISRYIISVLNFPVVCFIVNDEEFVKSNSKRWT